MEFEGFPKMPRLSREVIITEKIDGTNAQILIVPRHTVPTTDPDVVKRIAYTDEYEMFAGSRTQWLTTGKSGTKGGDNFGFAKWVEANHAELFKLGPGRHFGEWWGNGIQRGYGLQNGDKRFSLFNSTRWADPAARPAVAGVVPVLYQGPFTTLDVEIVLDRLRIRGSVAAPGFMKPEGVIVFHTAAGIGFKKTIEGDAVPKSRAA